MATTASPAKATPATGTRGRFVWHERMTTDLAAAQAFYTKVVGWKTSKTEGGFDYTFWLAGNTPVAQAVELGGKVHMPAATRLPSARRKRAAK